MTSLLALYIKHVQRNELTAQNSPSLFLLLTLMLLIFLYAMSTWLDSVYNTGNYFFIIALIPTVTHSVAWIFAYSFRTGHFFDLNGEVSLLITLLFSLLSETDLNTVSWRKLLVNLCVIVWDIRLGAFCFIRMIIRGKDFRFEEIKHSACFYLSIYIIIKRFSR